MNNQKKLFTIKDLENLSGIKAHTIRIWEKRYSILSPLRNDNNIRTYDTHALQKLLNIKTLNSFGYKISTIANLAEEKIPVLVREILSNKTLNSHVISNFKLAMMNFDVPLFFSTYNTLLAEKSFRDIVYDCFIPLLEEVGELWQTETITPIHEHFISQLVKQKIISNIEKLQAEPPVKTDRIFVLYLPQGEVHDICLMLLNYELILNGYQTIYLGTNVPMESLKQIKDYFDNIAFVTCFTLYPHVDEVNKYIEHFKEEILNDESSSLYTFGRNSAHISTLPGDERIKKYDTVREFSEAL
ncbi:MAG: MerR family transcriptional regulator [Bacteroidota bacterium]